MKLTLHTKYEKYIPLSLHNSGKLLPQYTETAFNEFADIAVCRSGCSTVITHYFILLPSVIYSPSYLIT